VKQVECSGVVVDWRGRPVADAEVVGSEQLYEYAEGRIGWGTLSRTTTDEKGRFQLQMNVETTDSVCVVAWKKGLALGWERMRREEGDTDLTVRLGEATVLAGVVVDEQGKGIAGATIRPWLKMDQTGGSVDAAFEEPREWFTVRTDDQGRFRLDRIPVGATADFGVEAPGRASCWTHWSGPLPENAGSQFKAGQTDIRIVLKPEAIIRGRVVDEDSGQGVPGIRLLARPNAHYANYACVAPVTSGPDGSFLYRGLPADDYSLQVAAPQYRTADWAGKDMKVTTQAGQTVDANITVSKGGLIEVMVQESTTGKPVENAAVTASQPAGFGLHPCWYQSVYTNAEGLARLRVPAGQCQLRAWARTHQGRTDPETLTVTQGGVVRWEARLDAFPVATGTVHDPNGQPAVGAIVASKPVCEAPVRTDKQGQFRVTWRPYSSVRTVLVLARDPVRNLAGLAEVAGQSEPVDVTLGPAYVVRGRVTDPNGKPIPRAAISMKAYLPGWRTEAAPAVPTDANGVYEVRALPAPSEVFRYELHVSASGYGPTQLGNLPFEAARSRQVEADPVTLRPADRSISGVIVDANDVPASGVIIYITGPRGSDTAGQPSLRVASDKQGRFAVNGVCAGPLRIQAGFRSDARGMSLFDAQGGDQNLKIVLGRDGARVEAKPLLGKPLPAWRDLIDLDPEQAKGKPILLCFFDMSQRPSRHCIDALTKQAEALRLKGVIVAAVQVGATDDDAWNAWIKERGEKYPLGQVRKDVEKVKLAWGVQSLPWLILTDKGHIVRAEGFGVTELGDRIKEVDK
jgi:protocatechuate 3,4-dioxygenase beta subunit